MAHTNVRHKRFAMTHISYLTHPYVRQYSFGAITHCVYAMGSVCACVPLADKNQHNGALTGLLTGLQGAKCLHALISLGKRCLKLSSLAAPRSQLETVQI